MSALLKVLTLIGPGLVNGVMRAIASGDKDAAQEQARIAAETAAFKLAVKAARRRK